MKGVGERRRRKKKAIVISVYRLFHRRDFVFIIQEINTTNEDHISIEN
jgi:hypothetical protein